MDMKVTNPKTNAAHAALACEEEASNALKLFTVFMSLFVKEHFLYLKEDVIAHCDYLLLQIL